jgi:hypothetical protein
MNDAGGSHEHEFTVEFTMDGFVVDRRNIPERISGASEDVGSKPSN